MAKDSMGRESKIARSDSAQDTASLASSAAIGTTSDDAGSITVVPPAISAVRKDTATFRTPMRPMVTGNRLTRLHQFDPISSLRLQMCSCCGKRFALGRVALRCKVCRLVVHEHCQSQVSVTVFFVVWCPKWFC